MKDSVFGLFKKKNNGGSKEKTNSTFGVGWSIFSPLQGIKENKHNKHNKY